MLKMLQEALYSFISVVLVDSNDQFSESQHDVKLIIDLSADKRYIFIKLKFAVNIMFKPKMSIEFFTEKKKV